MFKRKNPPVQEPVPGEQYEDVAVPEWLENSILSWLHDFFYEDAGIYGPQANLDYCLAVERLTRSKIVNPSDGADQAPNAVLWYLKQHPRSMWLVIDERLGALSKSGRPPDLKKIVDLMTFLIEAGAAYEVANDYGRFYLRRRLPPGVQTVIDQAEKVGGDSSRLLRSAFDLAYGRDPNYGEAYSKAVKAVEAAAIPVVIPNDNKATLGKVIGQLRATPTRWKLALQDPDQKGIEALISMLDVLWASQHDRHGGVRPLADMSRAEAEAAIHLAAALVYWFSRAGFSAARSGGG